MRDAHSASAAASHGLDHHRITDALGHRERVLLLFNTAFGTRRGFHPGLFRQRTADRLVRQRVHRPRARSDEADVAAFANFRKVCVLRQKSVAGMNRVHIRDFRRANNTVNPQVAFRRCRLADANRLVGHLHMHRIGVHFGIHRDRADIQFLACTNDADGDFPAVGDQNFFKHGICGMWFAVRLKPGEL